MEKERDVESQYDYFGVRYYDSRICRWLAVDPLAEKYAFASPYAYTLGNPISFVDVDGREILPRGSEAEKAQQRAWYAELRKSPEGRAMYDFLNAIPEKILTSIGRTKDPKSNAGIEHKGWKDKKGNWHWSGAEIVFDPSNPDFNVVRTPAHEFWHAIEAKNAKEQNKLNQWWSELKQDNAAAEKRAWREAVNVLCEYIILHIIPIAL